jgi:SMI1 / KNR4 family (SUKH-1)
VETTRSTELLRAFHKNPPATADEIEIAEHKLALKLPEDYRQFLIFANGGEGFIGPNSYLMLWQIGELFRSNREYEVYEYAPGLLLFGSNGGGEGFAFDMRGIAKAVVAVPFIGMSLEDVKPLAATFEGFLEHLAVR